MNTSDIYLGILSGGAGTRLWPVSRKSYPKQFYALAGKDPLLIETLKRVEGIGSLHILTTKQLQHQSLGLVNYYKISADVIGEPAPQNTAPIISLFSKICLKKNPNAIVCIFPADSFVQPAENFRKDLAHAIKLAEQNKIVTFGIPPTYPATAYGYLKTRSAGESLEVSEFIEKPNAEKAKTLISEGALWNSGTFVFKASVFEKLMKQHAPEVYLPLEELKEDLSNVESIYKQMPSISIDYALMEKLSEIACVKASFKWSDLGSWEEVASHAQEKHPVSEVQAKNNFYTSSKLQPKTVSFVGTEDLIAVDTPDALLVMKKGHGQNIKELVDKIKKENEKVCENHVFEDRPWGRFEILRDTEFFKSKVITVWPGQRLSYQSHKHRMEHWIITQGTGEFTLDDKKIQIRAGDHLFIPLGAKHRISNTSDKILEFVEVQLGTYFGEDDIVRYDDDYGRN